MLGAGGNQLRVAAQAAALEGNVRVGLEDSIWAGQGELATSNAVQVTKVRQIIEELGLAVASEIFCLSKEGISSISRYEIPVHTETLDHSCNCIDEDFKWSSGVTDSQSICRFKDCFTDNCCAAP